MKRTVLAPATREQWIAAEKARKKRQRACQCDPTCPCRHGYRGAARRDDPAPVRAAWRETREAWDKSVRADREAAGSDGPSVRRAISTRVLKSGEIYECPEGHDIGGRCAERTDGRSIYDETVRRGTRMPVLDAEGREADAEYRAWKAMAAADGRLNRWLRLRRNWSDLRASWGRLWREEPEISALTWYPARVRREHRPFCVSVTKSLPKHL